MKSTIDWNEIVPLLKKPLRDTLMLEAVLILSKSSGELPTVQADPPRRHTATGSGIRALGLRSWRMDGDGGALSSVGRYYKINRAVVGPQRGKIGRVWKLLRESQKDVIAYEGLASLLKGQESQIASGIAQLWEMRTIDVTAKPVALAYVGPQGGKPQAG